MSARGAVLALFALAALQALAWTVAEPAAVGTWRAAPWW